ncbi:M4 family metallopeptidase [Actinokineospora auranticolor]|uniref:Zn-dependent metalloprotease n=1 Tax=Actinokineospora auranticolor TaxID=155976 RepID=A0A2S6GC56_9PSEU|nr:M4 family metallopeptidase [Actinokineospora auranticolor]PPK62059.1 Zn-dependent metalloprotease [Actinokineospora auranticolor]
MKRRIGVPLAACLAALSVPVVMNAASASQPAPAAPAPAASPLALANSAGDLAAASGLDALAKGPDEQFVRRTTYQGGVPGRKDLFYVSYDRTYKGLPVIGGDAVVATDSAGKVLDTVAANRGGLAVDTKATITAQKAEGVARAQVSKVDSIDGNALSVLSGGNGKLVYETIVAGHKADGVPTRLHVYVNARTGAVEGTKDDVRAGTGQSQWNGPNPLNIDTSNNQTVDPIRSGVRCVDYSGGQPFTKANNSFGNGNATSKETGCVDVLWSTQHEWDMLKNWLGRSGINGSGGGVTVQVGLNQVNAYWTGDHIEIGHNNANQWIGSMDVVGHEHGHAIDQYTPGGAGQEAGLGEGTGDIFGALTEAYTNEPSPYDTPDYTVGESVNLVGQGPIRNMANPSLVNGDPNCYSSRIPSTEVHAAAGPLNHWFYLLAEGSNPGGGKPTSPTCNNSSVTGIGIQAAGRVFYNAMLLKTSGMSYNRYRTATLTAAKNLDPTCAQYNATKAAWNAVSVAQQSGEPTCTPQGGNEFSIAVNPTSGTVQAGGSTSATVSTSTTSGTAQSVALTASGQPSGVTVTFNPATVNSGATSTANIAVGSNVTAGTYPIVIKGTGTATNHTVTYNLTVGGQPPANDFSLALNPTSGSTDAGSSVSTTVGTTTTTGSAQTVTLTASGLPTGATATFSPSSVTTGGNSTLTIATTSSTPAGQYSVTVTASGSANHTATFSLTVNGGNPPGGCGSVAEWSSSQAYVPNDLVSHGSHKWKSTWYSTGAEPGAPGSWAVWQDQGAC